MCYIAHLDIILMLTTMEPLGTDVFEDLFICTKDQSNVLSVKIMK